MPITFEELITRLPTAVMLPLARTAPPAVEARLRAEFRVKLPGSVNDALFELPYSGWREGKSCDCFVRLKIKTENAVGSQQVGLAVAMACHAIRSQVVFRLPFSPAPIVASSVLKVIQSTLINPLAKFFERMFNEAFWKCIIRKHKRTPKEMRQYRAQANVIICPRMFRHLSVASTPRNFVHAAVILEGDLAFTGNRFGAPFKLVPVEI